MLKPVVIASLRMVAGACLLLLLYACGSAPVTGQALSLQELLVADTYWFVCDDASEFVARIEDGKAWLFLPAGTLAVPQISADSYRSAEVLFRIKGQTAELDNLKGQSRNCRNDRRRAIWEHAKLNGADFRATGNEPGWTMEIRNQSRIILTTDYGTERYEFDLPEAEIDTLARTTRYETVQGGQTLTMSLSGQSCRDTMSGEAFESKVEILFKGRLLRGCGRALH